MSLPIVETDGGPRQAEPIVFVTDGATDLPIVETDGGPRQATPVVVVGDGPTPGEGMPVAPDDGGLYAGSGGTWTELGSAATEEASSFATAAQGDRADSAVQPDALAPVATSGDYADLLNKPTIPAAQVNSDWNASSGVAQILNKPTIPAAQVNSDWNASSGVAEILNKPTIPTSPGGDFVGTTATQTLTNKTLGAGTKEAVDTVGDLNINVNSAPFMQVELAANATAFVNLAVGVSRSLWVNPATYTVTIPSGTTQVNFPDDGLPASKWSLITFTGKPGSTDGIAIYVSTLP